MGFKKRESFKERHDRYQEILIKIAKHNAIGECHCGQYGNGCDCWNLSNLAADALATNLSNNDNLKIPTREQCLIAQNYIRNPRNPSIRSVSTVLAYQFGFELNDDNSITRPK